MKVASLLYRYLFVLLMATALVAETAHSDIPVSLTETEAAARVLTEESAKEAALDRREAELRSADVLETAIARVGNRAIIFNREAPRPGTNGESAIKMEPPRPVLSEAGIFHEFDAHQGKKSVHMTLSGTAWDGEISELWWNYEGVRCRIFVNADFLLFSGLSEFEDEQTRYSLFTIITGRNSGGPRAIEKSWQPSLVDFSSEGLEYIIVDPKNDAKIDPAAFARIEAMLLYYAANHEKMQIRYDNAQKLRKARATYLYANPSKERDTIINFRPRKNTLPPLP